jgi:hypothetical protein
MLKFIIKKDIESNKILDVYNSLKDAASSVNTASPYISQALRLHGNSCGYKWDYVDVENDEIIEMLNTKENKN